jgi:D-glycero-alpha-D-manno-heptose 1-phosphate guanylyltransferase
MRDAIVLAGGFGTRLRSVVSELPKAMAPVNGRPFLAYVLDGLIASGFDLAVLAIGYRGDQIRQHFGHRYRSLDLRYSVETEPRGTGGGIRLAMEHVRASDFLVLNGDTYLEVNHAAMLSAHMRSGSRLTVAVHAVDDAGRFGTLAIEDGRIRGFREKGRSGPGAINAGVYVLSRELFSGYSLPSAFSFEADFLMPHVDGIGPLAFATEGIFIDIGVPEDYERAQHLLATLSQPGDAPAAPT